MNSDKKPFQNVYDVYYPAFIFFARKCWPRGRDAEQVLSEFPLTRKDAVCFLCCWEKTQSEGTGYLLVLSGSTISKGDTLHKSFLQATSLRLGLKTLQRIVDILFNWSFLQPSMRRALTLPVPQWRGSTIWEAMSQVYMIWDPAAMLVIWAWARLLYGMLPKLSGPRCLHLSRREKSSLCPL